MFRPASRLIACSSAVRALPRAAPARRFLSTASPSQKSRSWKSLAGRVGIAGAVIYFYNTTEVFAEEPSHAVHSLPQADEETEQLPTIEVLAQERQQRKAEAAAAVATQSKDAVAQDTMGAGGVEGLEEEAGQQGAFNPETGEINWDCPCLGGMATGPCGEQFKAAFSCFVFSNEEPKGMDCIDKFKDMQGCFREYPEVYGNELETDEEEDVAGDDDLAIPSIAQELAPSEKAADGQPEASHRSETEHAEVAGQPASKVEEKEAVSENESLIPKAVHDERANEQKD